MLVCVSVLLFLCVLSVYIVCFLSVALPDFANKDVQ